MVGHVCLHGTDHRDVVDALPDVGKNLTDFDPALTVALELEGRPHNGTGSAFGDQVHAPGEFLAVVFVECRLVVEGIDVGRTAAQEQVNHAFGLGGKVWLPRRQREVEVAGRARWSPNASPITPANASAPMPMPPRQSKSRRVSKRSSHRGWSRCIGFSIESGASCETDRGRPGRVSELAPAGIGHSSRSNGLPSISFHCFFWASVSRASILPSCSLRIFMTFGRISFGSPPDWASLIRGSIFFCMSWITAMNCFRCSSVIFRSFPISASPCNKTNAPSCCSSSWCRRLRWSSFSVSFRTAASFSCAFGR